jgi:hypothetical protein
MLLILPTLFALANPSVLVGASVLPRLGFSIPPNGDMAAIAKAAAACVPGDAVVIMPPVYITLGDVVDRGGAIEIQEQIIKSMPEGTQFYAHLKIVSGRLTQAGKEQEKILTARIADALNRLPLNNVAVGGLMVEAEGPLPAPDLLSFALADIAVKSKAKKETLRMVFSFPPGFLEEQGNLVKRLANYYDVFGTAFTTRFRDNLSWIAEQALNKPVFLKLEADQAVASPEQLALSFVEAALATTGTSVEVLWVEQPAIPVLGRLCDVTNFLSRSLPSNAVAIGAQMSPFSVTVDGSGSVEYKIFTAPRTRNSAIMMRLKPSGGQGTVRLHGPSGGQFEIRWYDAITGRLLAPEDVKRDSAGLSQTCACEAGYAFILIRDLEPSQTQLHTEVEVTARADLTVEEVVARWQQYKESQRQILDSFVAACFMKLHFESAGFGSGFDVAMRFQEFWNREGLTEWVQSDLFVNGVKIKSRWEFPLPQLEPEKVLTPPLELKLNEKYTYRIQGADRIDGQYCYVIAVEPKEQNETLYSGTIWIEGTKFRQIKMELRQKGAGSNAIANVETQNYALVSDGRGNEINLLKSIYAQQTLNAAGRNYIVERTYDFSDYAINPGDFESSLAAARLSDSQIYRDTDTGLQVLRKEGNQRVLVPRKTGVRSLVAGALYEGSYNFPIPLAGLSLVDFNFRGTGSQLSVFFAGPILAADLSKQWKSRFRVGLDVALSALPGNNRIFLGNTETNSERLWVFEETVGMRATWQASTDLSFTGSFYLPYNRYRATGDTAKSFILPQNGMTLMPGFELKYARNGYILNAGASVGRRVRWADFGLSTPSGEPIRQQFDKYYADFTKNFYYGKFMKTGFQVAYYSGDGMDRFSRYSPSFLAKPNIRGIPSGTDSFDNIGLASIGHGINIFDFIRFEGFYNHAWVRNKAESPHFRGFDGLEMDFGTAGPWGSYFQGVVTYALTGDIARYNSRWGVYFLVFKPLR